MTKVAIASDHAGYDLKEYLKEELVKIEFVDLGTNSTDSVDYPDYGHKLAEYLKDKPEMKGVLVCGSGIGISIAANRHKHIRAALCQDIRVAKLARQHNDANVIAMGARIVSPENAVEMVKAFLSTEFEGGRHQTRLDKL